MLVLINYFLDTDSNKGYARRRLAETKAPIRTASSSDIVNNCTKNHNDDRRIAHNMASRFKRDNVLLAKFGKITTNVSANYIGAANVYYVNH